MNTNDPEAIWDGIETCPVHPAAWVEDCDGCENEAVARGAVIEQMHAELQHRLKGLSQHGVPVSPMALDHIKVEILWEAVFNGRSAYLAEGELGRRAIQMVKSMQEQTSGLVGPQGQKLSVVKNGRTQD